MDIRFAIEFVLGAGVALCAGLLWRVSHLLRLVVKHSELSHKENRALLRNVTSVVQESSKAISNEIRASAERQPHTDLKEFVPRR